MKFAIFCFLFFAISEAADAAPALDKDYAAKALSLSLHCTTEAHPNTYERGCERENCSDPASKHPAFFGCYDWHSAVHGHWAMIRVLEDYPDLPESKQAVEILNAHLTKENLQKELAFFKSQRDELFERPYGWAWFLRLAQEVRRSSRPEAKAWGEALAPLETYLVDLSERFLGKLTRPMRVGAHPNTAFALTHMRDYAVARPNQEFLKAIDAKARELYLHDRNCPLAYEPSDGDFISPCFVEADLMRRVLPAAEFRRWFDAFLPKVKPELLKPVVPNDRKDYILGHLVGLMFQKASSMRAVAAALPASDPRRAPLEKAAKLQAETGWNLMFTSGYGGTHWLATFAIFYFDKIGL